MSDMSSNEKILLVLHENVYAISHSLSVILDSLMDIANEDIADDLFRQIRLKVLSEINGTINLLKKVYKEVPSHNLNEESAELALLFQKSIDNVLEGFESLLSWYDNEGESKDKLNEAIDKLFVGAQQTLNLVDKIL